MKSKEIICEIMKERGISKTVMAEKLGYSTPSGVTERLYRNSKEMRVDILISFLDALDCELVIRSKLKDKGEWKVGGDK